MTENLILVTLQKPPVKKKIGRRKEEKKILQIVEDLI
jgi:hypothetical protein